MANNKVTKDILVGELVFEAPGNDRNSGFKRNALPRLPVVAS